MTQPEDSSPRTERNVPKKFRQKLSRSEVNRSILANLALPKHLRRGWLDIAKEHNVPIRTVYVQITKLRKQGLVGGSEAQASVTGPTETPGFKTMSETHQFDPEDMLERIKRGEVPDEKERKQMLSLIMALGTDQHKIAAIKELGAIDAAKNRGIGPPPPSNDSERVQRLAAIMYAVGQDITKQATEAAFGQLAKEVTVQTSGISGNDGESGGNVA